METDENLQSQLEHILNNSFNRFCFECGNKKHGTSYKLLILKKVQTLSGFL